MATVMISFEGQRKIRVDAPAEFNRRLAESVPGVNVGKNKRIARFARDEIVYLFVVKKCKQHGNYEIAPDVKAWAMTEALNGKQIARTKSMDDTDLQIKYAEKLRKYQRVDVEAMKEMKRLILGNEPGTGKTLESIAYCDEIGANKVLIIASKSLLGGWQNEINRWSSNPDSIIVPVESTYKRKEKMLANLETDSRFYIINYEMLRDGYYKPIWSTKWDVVICDEAHRLKGRATQQTEGISRVKSDSLILATGTWITNNHHEVFQLLQLIEPNKFGSYWQFVERFCKTEENYYNEHAKNIVGAKNLKAYKYMMNRYLIQRRKREVLTELPDVIHKTVPIEMTPYQKKHYNELIDELMTEFEDGEIIATPNVLSQYAKLRQLLLSPQLIGGKDSTNKTQAALDIIENTDEQVVLFSWHRKYIEQLETILTKKKISYRSIHGKITGTERTKAEVDFRNGKAKVMLGTIKAMSEGLNLQTASVLIFTDKSYVPADNEQAISRVDRMGQKKSPIVYHLTTMGTVEEQINKVLKAKQDLIDEASAIEEVIKMLAR